MSFNLFSFMQEWRDTRHTDGRRITQAELDLVRSAIAGTWEPAIPAVSKEPKWLKEARACIGEREIPGPRHNSWIAKGWARLGVPWFNDDETPWCGFFVAHCIDAVGLPYPKLFPRALAWSEWGKACPPTVGAIVTFKRRGGGHVGFLVGENASNFYVLGGNQSNMVNIQPIAKNRMHAIRWPVSTALPTPGLPRMAGGAVSTNEQ